MQEFWLKALGMGPRDDSPGSIQHGERISYNWVEAERQRGLLEKLDNGSLTYRVLFRRQPRSIERGDRIVFYAPGWKLVFAEGEVISYPYNEPSDRFPHFTWCVNVRVDRKRDFIHDGIPLNALSVDGRDLPLRMLRRSHIRLTQSEYEAAKRALSVP